jgi:putative tricarboxylic transport membrane protein
LSSRLFDVYTMLGFGTLVFVMRRYGYPAAPFVLGLVLGDILDKNLRRGLVLTDGDILPFFTRPISAILAALVIWTFITNVKTLNDGMGRMRTRLFDKVLGRERPST